MIVKHHNVIIKKRSRRHLFFRGFAKFIFLGVIISTFLPFLIGPPYFVQPSGHHHSFLQSNSRNDDDGISNLNSKKSKYTDIRFQNIKNKALTTDQKPDTIIQDHHDQNTGQGKYLQPIKSWKIIREASVHNWNNDLGIIHVVYSRFMQYQPNLVELGLARLELFKTICLPTMQRQTNQQFLWIIRTDPDLHQTLRAGLLDALHGMINVVVVGSNEVKKGSINGGFRSENAVDDVTEDSLFFGKMHLVQSYHRVGRQNTIVETILDTDDGLGINFVETLQQAVKARFKPITSKRAWMNYCVGRHLEWQYYAPWDESTKKGSLAFGSTHICVTAGLSWATMAGAAPSFTEAHHLIKQQTKSCLVFHKPYLGCWEQLPEEDLLAIRARTPTSTGMARVLTTEDKWTKEDKEIDQAQWPLLEMSFGIPVSSVQNAHQYLEDHLGVVVEENLKGQCRKDHSCSEGIKKKLKKILYHSNMWKNQYGVVHVIQTSVDSEMSAHVLDHFTFDSLEAQTSYDFLWIIRLKELEESEEVEDLLTGKIVGKSPLNVLVVKSDQSSGVEFRKPQAIGDISEETLLYGEMEMLEDYHRAAQNRTLLETTLEPFDALSKTFVEDLQSSTVRQIEESEMMDESKSWYYRCDSRYIEWDYFTPEGYDADSGFLRVTGSDDGKDCVQNPGLTRISLPNAQIPYFGEVESAPECQVLVVRRIQSGCFIPASSNQTSTARAIIPESVEKPVSHKMDPFELQELVANDGHLRGVLRDSMNIFPATIAELHSHIRETQCSDSELCNPAWDSEYGVTHVVQTSIQSGSDYLYWRHFCLSLESQSTTKFLWIIRISLDPKLEKELLKAIDGIALNVIVVKAASRPSHAFWHTEAVADIKNETLVYGDMNALDYYHRSAQRRPLLETFLQPTDSLSKRFIATIQKLTAAEVKEKKGSMQLHGAWYYRCALDQVTWSSTNHSEGLLNSGVVSVADRNEAKCIDNPGTTRISLPGTDIPLGDMQNAASLPCIDGKGWFPNGCVTSFQDTIRTARAFPSDDQEDRNFGSVPGIYNATQLRGWWFNMLRTDFGLHRIALQMMQLKMTQEEKSPELWHSERDIVHVVYSRFLQRQGGLLHLGTARLKLFQALCLPSVAEQTNKNFLWVIRTDPELLPELKEGLIDAVKGLRNVVVVASDVGIDGFHDGSFRKDEAMEEFNKESILFGDIKLVQLFHEASKRHTLVETNFDTDDGMALTFVDNVQNKVDELFMTDRFAVGWVQLCIGPHLEWHFYSPWEKKSKKGCLLHGKTRTCIKSGLSWATRPKSKPKFTKELSILKEEVEECPDLHTLRGHAHMGCWVEVPLEDQENDVMAIRAMSPASTGVARGEISKFDWGIKALLFDKVGWSLLDPYFYVRMENIKSVRAHLVDHMKEVSSDRERSKCTHEKTCFGSWMNEHRVVHVIYTSIHDPNYAYTWERVSLSSLTRQSSYELLWIIRVADFTDHRAIDSLKSPIEESPFADNIVVVKSTADPHDNFRSAEAIADITEERLVYGNLGAVKDFQEASQTRPLIETFLSPNEGLVRTFIDDLQVSALTHPTGATAKSDSGVWYYRCLSEYVERSYYTPNGEVEENGFLRTIKSDGASCTDQPATSRISFPGSVIVANSATREKCSHDGASFQNGCFVEYQGGTAGALRALLPDHRTKGAQELSEEEMTALKAEQKRFIFQLRLVYSVFPPKLTAMKEVMAGNSRKIIHIVHTWIRDPSSVVTWRHFCAESLMEQTSKNFVWIIRSNITEDELRKSVGNPLKYYFKDPRNVLLAKSDEMPTGDFRNETALDDITWNSIIRGRPDALRSVQQATQGRTVIETFLRPEESVSKSFVEDVHRLVTADIKRNNWIAHQVTADSSSTQEGLWYFQCMDEHIQWDFFSPVGETSGSGFLSENTSKKHPCWSSPGVTRISLPGSKVPVAQFPVAIEKCASPNKGGCYVSQSSSNLATARASIPDSIEEESESTQKASSPQLDSKEIASKEKKNRELLHQIDSDFGISASTLKIMRKGLRDSECQKKNGCTGQWASATGVVHVLYTSLNSRIMVAVWRWFCFALEAQTTKDFLWIIRVPPADVDLLKEVIKPTVKTPLNLVVVKSDVTPQYDYRQPEALKDLTAENIIKSHGHELEMVDFFHKKAQTSPLLETFLKPTDALGNSFIHDLQVSTADQLKLMLQTKNDTWYYHCVDKHIRWTFFSSTGKETELGSFQVVGEGNSHQLDRPGTTRISLPGAHIVDQTGDPKPCPPLIYKESRHGCYEAVLEMNTTISMAARVVIPSVERVAHVKVANEEEQAKEDKYMNDFLHTLKHEYSIGRGNLINMRKQMKEILLNPKNPKK